MYGSLDLKKGQKKPVEEGKGFWNALEEGLWEGLWEGSWEGFLKGFLEGFWKGFLKGLRNDPARIVFCTPRLSSYITLSSIHWKLNLTLHCLSTSATRSSL